MRLRPRPSVRLRLTALFAGLFVVGSAALLVLNFLLVVRQLSARVSVELPDPPATSGTPDSVLVIPGDQASLEAVAQRLRNEALGELARQSLLALVVMAVIAVVVAWWVSGRIIRPISDITDSVRAMTAHDLSARVALTGPDDELRALAATFDELLERIERASGLQRRLLANASHELRTPLANQRTVIDVALADDDPAAARDALELARSQNVRSQRILDALFLLAGIQGGQLDFTDVDLADLVRAGVAEQDTAGLRVGLHLAPVCVVADQVLLEVLVSNLLRNAVVHNQVGGFVEVSTGGAQLTVANSGQVVDEGDLAVIGEPFVRRAQRTRARSGLGLGLSLVGEIAHAHGARLDIASRPDGGLVVTVTFPERPPS